MRRARVSALLLALWLTAPLHAADKEVSCAAACNQALAACTAAVDTRVASCKDECVTLLGVRIPGCESDCEGANNAGYETCKSESAACIAACPEANARPDAEAPAAGGGTK